MQQKRLDKKVYLKNFNVKEIVFPSKLKGPPLSRISAVGVGCLDIRSDITLLGPAMTLGLPFF